MLLIRFALILACLMPVGAHAAINRTIHLQWGYSPPNRTEVTGFKLYQEGVLACQTSNPLATGMDCTVLLKTATTRFTLAATFTDGKEGPLSPPLSGDHS